ncbi:MAG: hypothetical protein U1E60_08980 [Reyranellaceae bacterium]
MARRCVGYGLEGMPAPVSAIVRLTKLRPVENVRMVSVPLPAIASRAFTARFRMAFSR